MSMWNRTSPRPCDDADAGDALLTLASAVALGSLLLLAWRSCSGTHRRRQASRPTRTPAQEHTWEGEGGRPLDD